MRRLLPLQACFLIIFVIEPAWGADVTPSDVEPPTSLTLHSLARQVGTVLNVKASYLQAAQPSQRIQDLLRDTEDNRPLSFTATSTVFGGKLAGEAELTYSPSDLRSVEGRGDSQRRMFRFGLTGIQGRLRYGMSYRSAGKSAGSQPDYESREVWGEWQYGVSRVRTSFQQGWNNVDHDPSQARLTQVLSKVSLALMPPSWPEALVTYSRGSSFSSCEPQGMNPQRNEIDSLEGTLAYTRPSWNLRWSSTYIRNIDQLHAGIDILTHSHTIGVSYAVNNHLKFIPNLSFKDDLQRWSGVHLDTPSASLSIAYQAKDLNVSLFGSYSRSKSSDGVVDMTGYNVQSVLSWVYRDSDLFNATLSFEAGYKSAADTVRYTEEISTLMRVKLAGVSWLEFFKL
jgi:hypothetical protein